MTLSPQSLRNIPSRHADDSCHVFLSSCTDYSAISALNAASPYSEWPRYKTKVGFRVSRDRRDPLWYTVMIQEYSLAFDSVYCTNLTRPSALHLFAIFSHQVEARRTG